MVHTRENTFSNTRRTIDAVVCAYSIQYTAYYIILMHIVWRRAKSARTRVRSLFTRACLSMIVLACASLCFLSSSSSTTTTTTKTVSNVARTHVRARMRVYDDHVSSHVIYIYGLLRLRSLCTYTRIGGGLLYFIFCFILCVRARW